MDNIEILNERARLMSENGRLLETSDLLKRQGDLPKSLAVMDRMVNVQERLFELAGESNDPDGARMTAGWLVNSLSVAADVLQSLGRDAEANGQRERAATIARDHLGQAGVAETERSYAAALLSQGRLNEALVSLAAARDFAERQGDPLKRVRIAIDRADIFQWLGDFQRAHDELALASEMLAPLLKDIPAREPGLAGNLVAALTNLQAGTETASNAERFAELYRASMELDYFGGLIARYNGEYEEAIRLLEKVLPHYQALNVGPSVEYQLAAVHADRGEFREALTIIDRIEPAFRAPGMLNQKLAAVLRVRAKALTGTGRPAEAVAILEEALSHLEKQNDPDLEWRVLWELGIAQQELGQHDAALESLLKSVEIVDRLRSGSLGYRLDSTYLADKLPMFEQAIELATQKGDAGLVADLIERIKARGLVLALREPGLSERTRLSADESGVTALSRQVDAVEFAARAGWTPALVEQHDRLQMERTELVERLRFSDPRWRTLSEPPRLDFGELVDILRKRKQCVLDMYVDDDNVTCVLLSGRGNRVARHTLSEDARRGLSELVRFLEQKDELAIPDSVDLSRSFGVDASAFLPEALLDQALQAESVIFMPHGALHLVPWAGLMHDGKRLFEHAAIAVLPNLASLPALSVDAVAEPPVGLIGNPDYGEYPDLEDLEAAADEIETISELAEGTGRQLAKPLVREHADEAAFWRLATLDGSDGAILHVACHGMFEADDPLASGLLFAKGKADAAEIARMRLRYDEVVLSACSTGWRPQAVGELELHGDDILGIPGAFLEAGARTVLVSIPAADDFAASALMLHYHEERVRHSPMKAFQIAQQRMLALSDHPPYTWIGFTLYGCT